MPFALPHTIVAGTRILAQHVRENFEAIRDRLNSLPTEGYAAESVTADKLADTCIQQRHIALGAIPSGGLAAGAVGTADIAALAVQGSHLGSGTLMQAQSAMCRC